MSPALALAGGSTAWYVARATGVVTLGFLTASVLLGILTSFRWSSSTWPRFVVEFVHRNVSLLVLVFLGVHVVAVVADGFAPIRWIDVVVPFVSAYRPFWLGLGAVALDLLLALVITSLLRHRIGYTAWRVVHWAAYACWPVAVVHGLGTGSDARSGVVLVFTAASVVAVLLATAWRISVGLGPRPAARALGLGAVVFAPVLLVVWLVSGPLADGWARKAGTPASALVASSAPVTTPPSSTGATSPGSFPASGFDATTQGTLHESAAPSSRSSGEVVLSLVGTLSGDASGQVDVELTGSPLAGGGVAMRSGTVTLSDGAHSYQGSVVGLEESQIVADMPGPGGASWEVTLDVTQLDQQRGTMTADVHVASAARPRGDDRGGDDRGGDDR
ncbi:MAG TPA: ferric reductase-like transmembrane domain-containing protein [Acidimicrobiia bacterium]|nr:ferric reductase-like transmembrane domain-containing protein [Acidimicrobiia bacterium]